MSPEPVLSINLIYTEFETRLVTLETEKSEDERAAPRGAAAVHLRSSVTKCRRSRVRSRRRATATVRRRCLLGWARLDLTNTRPPCWSHHLVCQCTCLRLCTRVARTSAAAACHLRLPGVPTTSPGSGDAAWHRPSPRGGDATVNNVRRGGRGTTACIPVGDSS